MSSLVEQLQADAINSGVRVSTLLRKVKLAAVKLRLPKVEEWVEKELNGYTGEVPEYRETSGHPKAFNPFHGWIDMKASADIMDMISTVSILQSVPSLESLVESAKTNLFYMPYTPKQTDILLRLFNADLARLAKEVNRSQITSVLDSVRNLVLDWALELERQGIMGSGISFDDREKNLAQDRQVNFHIGSIGSINGALNSDINGENSRLNIGNNDRSTNNSR